MKITEIWNCRERAICILFVQKSTEIFKACVLYSVVLWTS